MSARSVASMALALWAVCCLGCVTEVDVGPEEEVDESTMELAAGCHPNIDRCIETAEGYYDSNKPLYHKLVDSCVKNLCTFN